MIINWDGLSARFASAIQTQATHNTKQAVSFELFCVSNPFSIEWIGVLFLKGTSKLGRNYPLERAIGFEPIRYIVRIIYLTVRHYRLTFRHTRIYISSSSEENPYRSIDFVEIPRQGI